MNSQTFRFSDDQLEAIAKAKRWLDAARPSEPFFKIFGGAGTGKTSIARHIAASFPGRVAYGAYTAKAALKMVSAGCDGAATLHRLIYRPSRTRAGDSEWILNRNGAGAKADLVIIDECSMVDQAMARDLRRLRKPILLLGDPMQLPPINSKDGALMANPDMVLTQIHRQGSGSEIIDFAAALRSGASWVPDGPGDVAFISTEQELADAVHSADQIIAGENATITKFNSLIRAEKGVAGKPPQPGERLVSYANGPNRNILNGELFEVLGHFRPGRFPDTAFLRLQSQDRAGSKDFEAEVLCNALMDGPTDQELNWCKQNHVAALRFAYAITAHKAQGSQWPHVLVYDESRTFGQEAQRWLYTAITRASRRLTFFRLP